MITRFILLGTAVSLSGYLFLFGESGYFTILELRRDIEQVHSLIADLQKENQELSEEYISLKEARSSTKHAAASEAIILKFDKIKTSSGNERSKNGLFSAGRKIEHIRILYGFASFTIILTGAFILQKLQGWNFS